MNFDKTKRILIVFFRNSANNLVEQQLVFAGWEQGKMTALKSLIQLNFDPPALIFVQVNFIHLFFFLIIYINKILILRVKIEQSNCLLN